MFKQIVGTAALASILGTGSVYAATTADIVFIVDESGSMSGEHSWLQSMVSTLDSKLNAAGVTNNRYGVVGFGSSSDTSRSFTVGSGEMGTATEAEAALTNLVTNGGTEDGYAGMNTANGYSFRSNAAVNYILVTDEDRDVTNDALTLSSQLSWFNTNNAMLNAVVNSKFYDSSEREYLLGVDAKDNGYVADGAGGYTLTAWDELEDSISDYGTTTEDYSELAWLTYGAAWDLNQLRAGGDTATSFTSAFVDIKVGEIVDQTPIDPPSVPVPAALPLFATGLAGLGIYGRRRKSVA